MIKAIDIANLEGGCRLQPRLRPGARAEKAITVGSEVQLVELIA
jgi:hypothetical protein